KQASKQASKQVYNFVIRYLKKPGQGAASSLAGLLLLLCLLLCPMAAWGQTNWIDEANTDWYDDNSGATEFTISTPAQLAGLAKLVNGGNDFSGKTINLDADIRLNDTSGWESWETTPPKYSWTPIGTLQNQFYGTFDGQGYTVSGIYISGDQYQGLFGVVRDGTIKNLTVAESYIYGNLAVGGVVGYNAGQVLNCSNSGTVIGSTRSNNVGGVVGYNNTGQVSNCSNSGTVEGLLYIGGVIGSNHNGTASYCSNIGTVRGGDDWFVGGVVGVRFSANVSNCYYLEGTCDKGVGGGSGTTENVEMKTEAEYKSGEVAFLLQDGQAEQIWGQKLGEGGDSFPVIGGPRVVKVDDDVYKNAYTLTINLNQPENGTISAKVNETPINSGDFVAEGTTVILIAEAEDGYEFDSWSVTDADNNEVAVTNNTFTMPANNVTVTATFKEKTEPDPEPIYYIITVDDMTNGEVTASPVTAKEGENVTLTVNPYSGYELGSLSVTDADNKEVTVTNNTFTMPASDVTVTATFKEKTEPDPGPTYYTITVDDNMTNGQVTASSATAEEGENVTLTVNPDSGYELWSLSVTDANGGSVPVNNYTFTMPASDVTVTATFTEIIPEPEPTYFTLDFDDHPCEGVTLNSNLTAVEEGGTLYLYVEKEDETLYDYDDMRIYAKRGANADWEELTEDPNRPGVYPIERIWTDIFIKVEGVTPIDPPTAIAGVETLRIYAADGLLHVEIPTRQRVTIVSMAGALIADGEQEGARIYRDLNAGIYIVRVGDYATKVRVE
ncbi:MAG TPA: hypothetical protein H9977_06325, partial [Candidatus Parabacteroides intestinipullorum]|nr:hypothetical protein [Candidatus Parabacteroides intestinipullorum]